MGARVHAIVKKTKLQKKAESSEVIRKRGRPTGKNREPLTVEQRRARNAQYEQERRNDYAAAMADLADAMGCDQSMPNADLLATVLSYLQQQQANNSTEKSTTDLKRQNDLLIEQIETLGQRLNGQENHL